MWLVSSLKPTLEPLISESLIVESLLPKSSESLVSLVVESLAKPLTSALNTEEPNLSSSFGMVSPPQISIFINEVGVRMTFDSKSSVTPALQCKELLIFSVRNQYWIRSILNLPAQIQVRDGLLQ